MANRTHTPSHTLHFQPETGGLREPAPLVWFWYCFFFNFNDDATQLMGASALPSVQQQQNPHDPGEEPIPLLLPRAAHHQLWAVPKKSSPWLLSQNRHIWEMCQSCCKATAEASAKVPATAVVAFVCMLLPLSQSVSFSCRKLELVWLSFREIRKNSNCAFMLK